MSNIRTAVEARQEAPEGPDLNALVRQTIERQSTAFRTVLPNSMGPERFTRLVLAAVKATPDLTACFRTQQGQTSLLIAAMQAAAVGLEPNTVTQDAWILPRKNHRVDEAQLMIGYRGLIKLAKRSPDLLTIQGVDVREGDRFEWHYGLERDHLHYEKGPTGERGELTHAYAIARFKDGGYTFVVLDKEDVHKRRAMSASWTGSKPEKSPWSTWTAEMWRKSAVRALMPWLQLTPEAMQALAVDEQPLRFDPGQGQIIVDEEWAAIAPPEDEPDDEPPQEPATAPVDVITVPEPGPAVEMTQAEITAAVDALLAAAEAKRVIAPTDGLGKKRAKTVALANEVLGSKYPNLGSLVKQPDHLARFTHHLAGLGDPGEDAF